MSEKTTERIERAACELALKLPGVSEFDMRVAAIRAALMQATSDALEEAAVVAKLSVIPSASYYHVAERIAQNIRALAKPEGHTP